MTASEIDSRPTLLPKDVRPTIISRKGFQFVVLVALGGLLCSCGSQIRPHYSGDGSKLPKLVSTVAVNVKDQRQQKVTAQEDGKARKPDPLTNLDASHAEAVKRVLTEALTKSGASPKSTASKTLHIDLRQLELATSSSDLTIGVTGRVRWDARVASGRTVSIQSETTEDMGLFATPDDHEKLISRALSEAAEKTLSHPTIQAALQ